DFYPVGPAVIFGDQCPVTGRADAEDPAEGNVGDVEIVGAIEARSLEEAVELHARGIGVSPRRAPLLAELFRHARELGRWHRLRQSVHRLSSLGARHSRGAFMSSGTAGLRPAS